MADVEGSVPQPRERQRPQAEGGAGDCRRHQVVPPRSPQRGEQAQVDQSPHDCAEPVGGELLLCEVPAHTHSGRGNKWVRHRQSGSGAGTAAPGSTTAGSAGRPAAAGSRSASACGPSLPVKPLFQLRVHRGPHATAALWARAALLTGLYHGTGMGRAKAQASQKDGALRVTQQAVEPWSCRTSWL